MKLKNAFAGVKATHLLPNQIGEAWRIQCTFPPLMAIKA